MARRGWRIPQGYVVLPEGFSLEEDEDCLCLLYKEKVVGTFSSRGATPAAIKKAAEDHLRATKAKPGR